MSDVSLVTTTSNSVITDSVNAALLLGLDIKKGSKLNKGAEGVLEILLADAALAGLVKTVIANYKKFPEEFKSFGLSEGLALLSPLVSGIQHIVEA